MFSTFRLKILVWCALVLFPCCTFDASGLKNTASANCGNSRLDPGETCDGMQLDAQTCETLGYLGGTLACAADCRSFNTSSCTAPVCGDGVKEGSEVCDGAALGDETCATQGFFGGILLCAADCRSFDTSSCTQCGNGVLDAGETCDGSQLDGKTCQNLGFFTGELACMPNCKGMDIRNCTNCGNEILDINEVCDGTAGIGETCLDRGCRSGAVTCASDCGSLVFAGCYAGHDEDADGLDDNCDNCPSVFQPQQNQANNDSDEIGDACEAPLDPLLVGGLRLFEPFTAPSPTWKTYNGNWSNGSDEVTGEKDLSGAGTYYYDSSLPAHGYSAEATFYFTSDPSDLDINPYAAVVFGVQLNGIGGTLSDGWACAWQRKENKLSLLKFETVRWNEQSSQSVNTSAGNNQWRRLRADVSTNSIACSYTDETMAPSDPPARLTHQNTSAVNGYAGLRINSTRAVFTSFVKYQSLPGTTK